MLHTGSQQENRGLASLADVKAPEVCDGRCMSPQQSPSSGRSMQDSHLRHSRGMLTSPFHGHLAHTIGHLGSAPAHLASLEAVADVG